MPERKCAAASGRCSGWWKGWPGRAWNPRCWRVAAGRSLRPARERGLRVEPLSLVRVMLLGRRHDLIHAHDARSHTLGVMAKPGRLVVSRRVAFPVGSAWKYRRARRYLAVSEFVKSVLVAGGVPEEKIAVVYDGVPLLEPVRGSSVVAPANADDACKGASAGRGSR